MFRKSMILLVSLLLLVSVSVHAQTDFDPTQPLPLYLLTIQGKLASDTLEDAQDMHNQTAGAPESIAAAQSLGDLSHMVYLPMPPSEDGAGQVLFIDQWSNIEGLNQFFANPVVQEQAGQLFSEREANVWTPAEGYYTYNLPAPYGDNERIIVMVQAPVSSREEAMAVHNQIVASSINVARQAGDISHEVYFKLTPPDEPESLDFLAVDVWTNAEGMMAYYADPAFQSAVQTLFAAPPTITIWNQTTGEWVEW